MSAAATGLVVVHDDAGYDWRIVPATCSPAVRPVGA
jgi:hypothetical protein